MCWDRQGVGNDSGRPADVGRRGCPTMVGFLRGANRVLTFGGSVGTCGTFDTGGCRMRHTTPCSSGMDVVMAFMVEGKGLVGGQ